MPDKLRMAILDDYQEVALGLAPWDRIADRVEVVSLNRRYSQTEDLVTALQPFDIVFAMRERTVLSGEVLERLARLKLIITAGPLNAAIDIRAAERLEITVCGTDYTSHSTVELTWALIFAAARQLPEEVASVRTGGWQRGVGVELYGRTLGVLGLGGVGSGVARIGEAVGMKVVAWSQNMTAELARAHGAELVDKKTLFQCADVVSIHLRLSDRTRGLVGAHELATMKAGAILVNTSRGPIVDEAALVSALERGSMFGAGLDVYDQEPLPADDPLRRSSRLVATPHIGYVSQDLYTLFYRHALEDVEAWLQGAPIRRVPDFRSVPSNYLPDWVATQST